MVVVLQIACIGRTEATTSVEYLHIHKWINICMLASVLFNANDNMPTTVALLNLLYAISCYCNEIAWHFFFFFLNSSLRIYIHMFVCMYAMPCVSHNFRHSFFYAIRRILHIRCHLGFCWFGDNRIPSYILCRIT